MATRAPVTRTKGRLDGIRSVLRAAFYRTPLLPATAPAALPPSRRGLTR